MTFFNRIFVFLLNNVKIHRKISEESLQEIYANVTTCTRYICTSCISCHALNDNDNKLTYNNNNTYNNNFNSLLYFTGIHIQSLFIMVVLFVTKTLSVSNQSLQHLQFMHCRIKTESRPCIWRWPTTT